MAHENSKIRWVVFWGWHGFIVSVCPISDLAEALLAHHFVFHHGMPVHCLLDVLLQLRGVARGTTARVAMHRAGCLIGLNIRQKSMLGSNVRLECGCGVKEHAPLYTKQVDRSIAPGSTFTKTCGKISPCTFAPLPRFCLASSWQDAPMLESKANPISLPKKKGYPE